MPFVEANCDLASAAVLAIPSFAFAINPLLFPEAAANASIACVAALPFSL